MKLHLANHTSALIKQTPLTYSRLFNLNRPKLNPMNSDGSTLQTLLSSILDYKAPNTFNPWSQQCEFDAIPNACEGRLERLSAHLSNNSVRAILVGEAAGYQGCRYSGVTFTSERLLLEGAIPGIPAIEKRLTLRKLPFSEPSATIVWGILKELNIAENVVMWNAFPWHPMKENQMHSNRTPTNKELQSGLPVLDLLLQHFHGVPVISVGKKSTHTLTNLGVKIEAEVRHPAMGGANKFREGMRKIMR